MHTVAIDKPREHRRVLESRIEEAASWCIDRFGAPGFVMFFDNTSQISGGAWWGRGGPVFYFLNEANAIEFKLRWV